MIEHNNAVYLLKLVHTTVPAHRFQYNKSTTAIMTRIVFFFVACTAALALFASGCSDNNVDVECIDGSGTLKTEQRTVGAFSGFVVSDNIEVVLQKGPTDVRIEADDNFLPYITTELRDSRVFLKVVDNKCLRGGTARVYLTIPELRSISTESSGAVKGVATFAAESITIAAAGSGEVSVTGSTTKVLSVSMSGSGNVTLAGRATALTSQLTGSGSLYAYNLATSDAVITLTGSGSAEVNVSKTLDVKLTGSGNVTYSGDPVVKSVITGSGTVRKKT